MVGAPSKQVLGTVPFGSQFADLNRAPLDEYATCATSAEIVKIQVLYMPNNILVDVQDDGSE